MKVLVGDRQNKKTGFTIVELLIVIVVIAILAAISIVAYTGIQVRARDSARTAAVQQIQKSLEAYRAENGVYPSWIPIGSNAPSGFSGMWGNYSYSVDTAGNWLRRLTDGGLSSSAPVDPINNNSHYFAYYSSASYGACKEPFYMLAVIGYEDPANIPSNSKTLICTEGTTTAHWATSPSRAVFSNISR